MRKCLCSSASINDGGCERVTRARGTGLVVRARWLSEEEQWKVEGVRDCGDTSGNVQWLPSSEWLRKARWTGQATRSERSHKQTKSYRQTTNSQSVCRREICLRL